MQPGGREIYSLTSLRFFAAGLVVFEHMQMLPGLEWLGVKGGFPGIVGVRIFFVLSGFIISYTYWNRDWSSKFGSSTREFYWSRFARIFPLHWLMFLLALPLGLNSHTARVSVAYFPWQLTLTDFLWPGLPAVSQPVKAAWTLSCEFLFYFSTPLLFWFLTRRKNPLLASGLLLAGYTIALLLLTTLWPDLNWRAYIEVPQFLLGVAGFQLARRMNLSSWAGRLMTSGGLLLAAAASMQDTLSSCASVPCTTRVMLSYCAYAPGALLLILGCANISGRIGRFLSLPFLVLLGHASYALYLFHDPALRYLKVVLNREGIVFSSAVSVGVALLLFCLLTGASIVCFKLYENPARLRLRSLLKRLPSETPSV